MKTIGLNKYTLVLSSLAAAILGASVSLIYIKDYLDNFYNRPDINIQFCDSKSNVILIKKIKFSNETEQFRLALEINNNSDKTYENIEFEFINLNKIIDNGVSSIIEFSIDELATINNQKKADSLINIKETFNRIQQNSILPGIRPIRQLFVANIYSNFSPRILPFHYETTHNIDGDSVTIIAETAEDFNLLKPFPVIEHKLTIKISGDNYPERMYFLTILYGTEESLSFFNRPIFQIDTINNNILKPI